MSKPCVVFVVDRAYYSKFVDTCTQLVTAGEYTGDICLVIGDDLNNEEFRNSAFIQQHNIIVKHFPNLRFSEEFLDKQLLLNRPYKWVKKLFQYHKLHIFNTFFKKWDYLFYLDCGITIYADISPMLDLAESNTMLAHADNYPKYNQALWCQFDRNMEEYTKLSEIYNLDVNYPQTTIMLFDTSLIEEDTFDNMWNLTMEYPISVTNDQGIIALYYTCVKKAYRPIPLGDEHICFYDYFRREPDQPYIMIKDSVFGR